MRALVVVLAALPLLAGCFGGGGDKPRRDPPPSIVRDGLKLPARVQGAGVAAAEGGRFTPRFWAGVNLGVTVPGHQPGELAPTREDYDRWLDGIGELGARVVRVYTILRPVFYDALADHNAKHPDAPLYFIQGVWIPEEEFLAEQDAYAPAVTKGFDAEIGDAVAAVHGDAKLPERSGHASGTYTSDVSRWLLAWSPGVEWDPAAVASTDRRNEGAEPFRGRYLRATNGATPMESWIAARLDHLAGLEAERGWSRPLTFTNWLTADPLEHPAEPLAQEDRVSVDAMHVRATAAWPGGFFASYHAYPYYPDFLRLDPRYRDAKSPYAAYLRDLKRHHRGQAVMITEFGVPTGLGSAHRGALGRDQGDHSEQEAAAMDADMLREIRAAGYAGGLLFEWTDEWFKRTWNTQDLALPEERRVLWHNVLTNETQFGVVAVEPEVRSEPERLGEGLEVSHDAAYLYVRLRRDDPSKPIRLAFDVRPGENGGEVPEADARITIGPGDRARMEIAAWTDHVAQLYGVARDFVPVRRADVRRGSGVWVAPRLILNRPYRVPTTGEERPAELMSLGRMRWGDPADDSRALARDDGGTVELRIPWMLLGFADPSSHLVFEAHGDGTVTTEKVGAIRLWRDARPAGAYDWENWDEVAWRERRKAGWDTLKAAMAAADR